jgi:hypothetical protein
MKWLCADYCLEDLHAFEKQQQMLHLHTGTTVLNGRRVFWLPCRQWQCLAASLMPVM